MLIHFIPAVVLSFVFHLFTHEIGHMIGGVVTGWKFIYLQIFNLVLSKERGMIKLKLVQKISFQCIMYPKYIDQGSRLYTLGGCIANFLITIIAFIAMFYCRNSIVLWFYSWCFFAVGISILMMNAIPSTKRICNDMACYLFIENDHETRQSHNAQMLIAKMLMGGYSYRDIQEELICLPVNHTYNDILAYHALLEYYYWLDKDNYELMQEAIHKIDYHTPISKSVLYMIKLERLYIDLIIKIRVKDNYDFNKCEYGEDLDESLSIHLFEADVHSIRVKTMYEICKCITNGEKNQVKDKINMGIEHIKTLPHIYPGEVSFCIRQLRLINDYFMDTRC